MNEITTLRELGCILFEPSHPESYIGSESFYVQNADYLQSLYAEIRVTSLPNNVDWEPFAILKLIRSVTISVGEMILYSTSGEDIKYRLLSTGFSTFNKSALCSLHSHESATVAVPIFGLFADSCGVENDLNIPLHHGGLRVSLNLNSALSVVTGTHPVISSENDPFVFCKLFALTKTSNTQIAPPGTRYQSIIQNEIAVVFPRSRDTIINLSLPGIYTSGTIIVEPLSVDDRAPCITSATVDINDTTVWSYTGEYMRGLARNNLPYPTSFSHTSEDQRNMYFVPFTSSAPVTYHDEDPQASEFIRDHFVHIADVNGITRCADFTNITSSKLRLGFMGYGSLHIKIVIIMRRIKNIAFDGSHMMNEQDEHGYFTASTFERVPIAPTNRARVRRRTAVPFRFGSISHSIGVSVREATLTADNDSSDELLLSRWLSPDEDQFQAEGSVVLNDPPFAEPIAVHTRARARRPKRVRHVDVPLGKECMITHDLITDGLFVERCRHCQSVYLSEQLVRWISNVPTCPVCKKEYGPVFFISGKARLFDPDKLGDSDASDNDDS